MWRQLDLAGRALLLLSVFLQLSFLSQTEEAKVETYRYYDLESQASMRDALRNMARGNNERAIDSLDQASDFLYSEYDNRFTDNEASTWYLKEQRIAYAALFALASIMLLVARAGELKEIKSAES